MPILLIFLKEPDLALFILCIFLFISNLFISALSLIISCLLLLSVFAFFHFRAPMCTSKLLAWDLSNLFMKALSAIKFPTLNSLCPISLGMLRLQFH